MAVNIKRVRKVEVSQETYDRLQQRAVPFEDTPESVIVKLLDESRVEGHRGSGRVSSETDCGREVATAAQRGASAQPFGPGAEVDVAISDPFSPPSLKHTKVLCAEVDGQEVTKANWATVRHAVVAIALDRGGYNLRRLLEVCPMNAIAPPKYDEGYSYYQDLGLSIQGQDANHAWQATAAMARALGLRVKVRFQWRAKTDAEYPGKLGLLTID